MTVILKWDYFLRFDLIDILYKEEAQMSSGLLSEP
jgi:hypothetical protein